MIRYDPVGYVPGSGLRRKVYLSLRRMLAIRGWKISVS